jgi:dolichol-phosphate mannosyltransferase
MQKRVTIVSPFLDEEESLPVLYERLSRVMDAQPEAWELILVDDGSTDGSVPWVRRKAAEDPRVKLIVLSRDFGHQVAITAGLDHATGDAVVIIDADLQDPPEVIPELLAKWREGFEIVYAVRQSRAGESWFKKITAKLFYRLFHRMAGINVPMDAGEFRLIDRKVVEALRDVRELHRFLRGLTCWTGFSQCPVLYQRAPRYAGRTKYPLWQLIRLAWDALTSFTGAPLRWMTGIGVAVSFAGLLFAARIVVGRLLGIGETVPGWTSLIAVMLVLGGIQLVCLGLMGQYISRIYEESKKRPLYFIRDSIGLQPPPPRA